jgi:chemotaxis protein CheZ
MPDASPGLIDLLGRSEHFIGALDEFAPIAATITRTRREIATLAPQDIADRRLRAANAQLGAAVADAERATNAIMTAVEAILALDCADEVKAQALAICEACAFQDITGQRVSKALAALGQIERRLVRFAAAMGLGGAEDARADRRPERRRLRNATSGRLCGPGINGPETDQEGVDALLAAWAA